MSRFETSGCDDEDGIPVALWYNSLGRYLNGPRGQANLRLLLKALDAMPAKRLIAGALADDGEVCFVGAVAAYRRTLAGEDWRDAVALLPQGGNSSPWDTVVVGKRAGLPHALAYEMGEQNDEHWGHVTPEERWQRARQWVLDRIIPEEGEEIL